MSLSGVTSRPVSSRTSRTSASVTDSPGSTPPPGRPQRPLSARRWTRTPSAVRLIADTAGTGAMGRVWDLEPLVWDRVLAVNLRGTFLLTRAASRWMVEQKRPGRIVNIASTNATVPTAGHSPYCASKAGVVALTQVAALELAPHRVTVNAIAPGPAATNLTAPLFTMPGAREEFLRNVPPGRMGGAEDIAQAILFLSSEAAEWVTGQCFYIDGGQSMVALPPYIDLVERLLGGKL